MADFVYPPVTVLVRTLWRALDLKITIHGDGHIPHQGGAVIASNHVSYLDFALVGTGFLRASRLIRFMAKEEVFRHPIAGPLMRGMKHISVDRNNGAPSYLEALKYLKSGEMVGIFPEATISQSFELKEMKSGAIRLARSSGLPIIPVAVWGSQRIWTKNQPRNFKRKSIPIVLSIGEPYLVGEDSTFDFEMNRLRLKLSELLKAAQEQYPDPHEGERWAPASLGGTAPTSAQLLELKKLQEYQRKEL
jgi:1-acyl-sn-glycerol-3-phosphate acyltransferase